MRKKKLEDVLEEARQKHNNFYSYSQIKEYNGCDFRNSIICPIHGVFYQSFYNHIKKGQGCPKCGHLKTIQANVLPLDVVKKRILDCGYKIPSDFHYINNNTPFKLICPKHGEFSIRPSLLFCGQRCKKCVAETFSQDFRLSNEEFISRLHQLYGDKIDTSKVVYKGRKKKVCVICKKHGEYYTTPESLYRSISCPDCKKETLRLCRCKTQEQFMKELHQLYGHNSLLFDKVNYVDENTPIYVGCQKHGYYQQLPRVLLKGHGCPFCKTSTLEKNIEKILKEQDIEYKQQYKVPNSLLRLDFYLPQYKSAIECQGRQHFEPVGHFGGDDTFELRKERDIRKKNLCNKNNIKLYYYSNLKKFTDFQGEKIYHNLEELLIKIKSIDLDN